MVVDVRSLVLVLGRGSKVLDSRSWVLDLNLESQIQGLGSRIFGSKFRILNPLYSVVITMCDKTFLYSVTGIPKRDIKLWQSMTNIIICNRHYNVWQVFQSATASFDKMWQILQSVTDITKCDRTLLQSVTIIKKWNVTH